VKAIIAAVIILASPGLACAETWELWEQPEFAQPEIKGTFGDKPTCLAASRRMADETAHGAWRTSARFGAPTPFSSTSIMSGAAVTLNGTVMATYRCWPVGVNPR
jgi:hypothetical protein